VNWVIEGDIQACFDEIEHHVLVHLLRKKIADEHFINLIWKLLNAGYMDLHGRKVDSLIGSPQGGIVSPILANVYLHELDEFIEAMRNRLERGKKKRPNLAYNRLADRKRYMAAKGRTKTKEFHDLVKQIRKTPAKMVNDPEFIRIKYLRYADDWIIGVGGSKQLAESIKREVKEFLHITLKLRLSEEKTHITHAKDEEAHFLGVTLAIGRNGTPKLALTTNGTGKRFKRRSTGWETVMQAPLPKVIKRLKEKGICTEQGEPITKKGWAHLDAEQIVALYSGINRGLQNYYRFADNWARMSNIQYILQFSLAKTLAFKFKISVKATFKRYGRDMCIRIPGKKGKEDREVRFSLNHDWGKRREAFQRGNPRIDQLRTTLGTRTRSKLGKPCCVCGKTSEETQIVMHHVRHIRKLSHKREAVGFNRILRMLNRKQIPVCEECHRRIHQGTYDGLKLSQLAYLPK